LVALCQCGDNKLAFAVLSKMPFGQRLGILRRAIQAVKQDFLNDLEMAELVLACDLAETVQHWRNDRIHAEVRFLENRPVLVDRSGMPLQINREACEQRIREANRAGIALEAAIPHLVACKMDLEELDID